MSNPRTVIIGAGPAGLTAGYELLTRSNHNVTILEKTNLVGGISKTVKHHGNRLDIGGHRFFSKSLRVNKWWEDQFKNTNDFLTRSRKSRIYYLRQYFDYPISLSVSTLSKLGVMRTFKIILDYLKIKIKPIKVEKNLEDFFINRFGNNLYQTFFRSYTEKVWGIPCSQIDPSWGAQRVKGLSISKIIEQAVFKLFHLKTKTIETSLIDQFKYPKYGPGQLWEGVAQKITKRGVKLLYRSFPTKINHQNNQVFSITISENGKQKTLPVDHLISSMPLSELLPLLDPPPSSQILKTARELNYRDFITVGVLLNKPISENNLKLKDNWLYIQEADVQMGRIQIFNNWSKHLLKDQRKFWLGLEYFAQQGDKLWNLPKSKMISLAISELLRIGLITDHKVIDSIVLKTPKAYPAYFGKGFAEFSKIKRYLNRFANIHPVGRNGMHRYNNQDHSMLTSMITVDQIVSGKTDKALVWNVNAEQEYHESKTN